MIFRCMQQKRGIKRARDISVKCMYSYAREDIIGSISESERGRKRDRGKNDNMQRKRRKVRSFWNKTKALALGKGKDIGRREKGNNGKKEQKGKIFSTVETIRKKGYTYTELQSLYSDYII